MLLTALALTLLGDIAPSRPGPVAPLRRPPPPPRVECVADDECRLSTFSGCCPTCCPPPPHAIPLGRREGEQCRAVECAMPDCAAVRCAAVDTSAWRALCEGGQCVARLRATECRVDADCRVAEVLPPGCAPGACGCCPVLQALPADRPVPLQRRPPATSPAPTDKPAPSFGLSTGDTANAAPPPRQCGPCAPPPPANAVCRAGRCLLQPVELPRPRPIPPG